MLITPDVLVVGAGPAGLATALSTARHGASVLVVERRPALSSHPRATGITTRTMEILRAWGLAREVRAASMRVPARFGVAPTLADPLLGPPGSLGYPEPRAALAVSPVFPALLAQDELEPLLAREVRRHGGEIRFGTTLTGLDAGPDRITGRLDDAVSVTARFVVGADGTRSAVRRLLGIDVEHLGRLSDHVQVLFRADLGPPRLPLVAITHPDAVGIVVAVGRDRWAFSQDRAEVPGLVDRSPRQWCDVLRIATGRPDLEPELLSVLPFTMAGELATAMRSGRGFLVGDAAHRMTPIGGIGMNTAIHDSHNLGWKLAWHARGLAGEELLASYAAERGPVARRNTLRTLQPGSTDEAGGLAWDLGVTYRSPVIAQVEHRTDGDDGQDGTPFAPHGRPGERAPHLWLHGARPAGVHRGGRDSADVPSGRGRRPGGKGGAGGRHGHRRMSTLDLFDGRLTLLTGVAGRPWRQAAARVIGVPLHAPTPAPMDALRLAAALGITGSGAVLVRPDGVVAWRRPTAVADHDESLSTAIAAAVGAEPRAHALTG